MPLPASNQLNSGYFVTGTDTNVGKTFVSVILANSLNADYWKPVQTGAIEGTDTDFVSRWIGADRVHPESYVFHDPLSPHLAAQNENVHINLNKIIESFPQTPNSLIVEGAGGVLVPLNEDEFMVDLMEALRLPVVLVASTRLGTINHTLLSVEALKSRSLPIAGIVMVGDPMPGVSETIQKRCRVPILHRVPVVEGPEGTKSLFASQRIKI